MGMISQDSASSGLASKPPLQRDNKTELCRFVKRPFGGTRRKSREHCVKFIGKGLHLAANLGEMRWLRPDRASVQIASKSLSNLFTPL